MEQKKRVSNLTESVTTCLASSKRDVYRGPLCRSLMPIFMDSLQAEEVTENARAHCYYSVRRFWLYQFWLYNYFKEGFGYFLV